MKYKLTNEIGIVCFKRFKQIVIPYAQIRKAYIRVEEASAMTCCARSDFSSFFVMAVLESGKAQKIQTADRKTANVLLAVIAENKPDAEIGYQIP